MRQDLRFAVRMIRSHPWFSAAIIATLALGIGINTAIFTLVNTVLFKPLPFRNGDRMVAVVTTTPARGQDNVSYPDYLELRAQSQSFESLEAVWRMPAALSEQGKPPEQYRLARVSAGFFDSLGVQPVVGRAITKSDAEPGADPVVMIGYGVWRDRYAQARDVTGRVVRINQEQATIIGVLPDGFGFPNAENLWMPLLPVAELQQRTQRPVLLVGVRKPGVSMDEARADLNVVARRLAAEYPDSNKDLGINVRTFHELQNGGAIRTVFLLMLGAVGFVLLIACANVANMMLSRALGRSREISIRAAMGASRWRILRQLLVESTLLSFLGGAIGLFMARYGVQGFSLAVADVNKPSWIVFSMNYMVYVYFAGVCLLCGILFGLAPGLRASKVDLNNTLKDGVRTAGSTRSGFLSGALVVVQFTLAVVLLTGAGLFIRGILAERDMRATLPTTQVLTARINLPEARYPDAEKRQRFFDQLLERSASRPGIQAALVSNGPGEGGARLNIQIEGEPQVERAQRPSALQLTASPAYFSLINLPILAGRPFDDADGRPGSDAVIVAADFAARSWPNQAAVGKRFRVYREDTPGPWLTVIGVSGIVLQQLGERQPDPVIFRPHRPGTSGSMVVLLRTARDPAALTGALRSDVQQLDPDLALANVMTLEKRVDQQTWFLGVFGSLFSVFAFAALLMASVGIYAVVAHTTGRRTREIGVRMALGASSGSILRLVLKRGLIQLAIGLVLGLGAAFGVTRFMSAVLFSVSPTDPIVFVSVSLVLLCVGLLACWLPARRAANMAPTLALRNE